MCLPLRSVESGFDLVVGDTVQIYNSSINSNDSNDSNKISVFFGVRFLLELQFTIEHTHLRVLLGGLPSPYHLSLLYGSTPFANRGCEHTPQ
ncbi:hypothetical protein PG984_006305 [Apiospora sp. TS-2023a]